MPVTYLDNRSCIVLLPYIPVHIMQTYVLENNAIDAVRASPHPTLLKISQLTNTLQFIPHFRRFFKFKIPGMLIHLFFKFI